MTADQLAHALTSSTLREARAAAEALRTGWTVEYLGRVEHLDDLASTYSVRLKNLRSKSEPHWNQLADSIAEFVDELATRPEPGLWWKIARDEEHHFLFLSLEDGTPVGCMRVVANYDGEQDGRSPEA